MVLGIGSITSGLAAALYNQLDSPNTTDPGLSNSDDGGQPVDNVPEQSVDNPPVQPEPSPSATRPSATPSPNPGYQGADPNTITSVGLGPFRADQPVEPLLNSGVARRPTDNELCPPSTQLVAKSGKYSRVTASQDGDLISHVIIRNGSFRTRSGLALGSSEDDVRAISDVQETTAQDAETKAFLVRDGGNALLFVLNEGEVTMIVVGRGSAVSRIAESVPSGVC